MDRYKTTICFINEAEHESDAADHAGGLVNFENMPAGMRITYSGTVLVNEGKSLYKTTIDVVNRGETALDAGELAGRAIDASKMQGAYSIYCLPTEILKDSAFPCREQDHSRIDVKRDRANKLETCPA